MWDELRRRWTRELDYLERHGRLRRLKTPHGVDFSSNDYLGLGREPLAADVLNSRPEYRLWSGTASRLLRGHNELLERLEERLAQWHNAESALFFTSGYAANEGLLSAILGRADWVASDEHNHASIIDGLRLCKAERYVFRHNDLNHLEEGLRQFRTRRKPGQCAFIVTESIFSMDGDRAPLRDLVSLATGYEAALIVDEAHATGCFGQVGQGLVDEEGVREQVLATVHTGGKAIGCQGAYICCPRLLRDYLINRCRHLIFTTAPSPAVVAAWHARVAVVQSASDRRERLHRNAATFRAMLEREELFPGGTDYIVPVVLGSDDAAVRAAEFLQAHGLDIRAIRPPTVPQGTARLRVSIHAVHTDEQIARCARLVAEAYRRFAASSDQTRDG